MPRGGGPGRGFGGPRGGMGPGRGGPGGPRGGMGPGRMGGPGMPPPPPGRGWGFFGPRRNRGCGGCLMPFIFIIGVAALIGFMI